MTEKVNAITTRRRTILHGAWAAPVVVAAQSLPAHAASPVSLDNLVITVATPSGTPSNVVWSATFSLRDRTETLAFTFRVLLLFHNNPAREIAQGYTVVLTPDQPVVTISDSFASQSGNHTIVIVAETSSDSKRAQSGKQNIK